MLILLTIITNHNNHINITIANISHDSLAEKKHLEPHMTIQVLAFARPIRGHFLLVQSGMKRMKIDGLSSGCLMGLWFDENFMGIYLHMRTMVLVCRETYKTG